MLKYAIVTQFIGMRFGTRSGNLMATALIGIVYLSVLAVPASPQEDLPYTVQVDVPFEMLAPWYTPDRTEIEDEVLLRGTLRVTTRTWQTRVGHIDRFALHANAVNIHGRSETTGQRFRVNGSFSYDLRDPDATFNADGTFNVPMQPFRLHFFKVDPQPAQVEDYLSGSNGATGAAVFMPQEPPVTVPCQRVYAPDGTATPTINCGSLAFTYFLQPTVTNYRVIVGSGSSCLPSVTCVVPDGATLFNGYTGDYNPPLGLFARIFLSGDAYAQPITSLSAKWRCLTGSREAPTATRSAGGSSYVATCRPFYSAVDPIRVWLEYQYTFWRYRTTGEPLQQVTLSFTEPPFTYRMDRRPVNEAPNVDRVEVAGTARTAGRCAIGQPCLINDGDTIFNSQVGDFDVPLIMGVVASDPEGDPLTVEWFCKQGDLSIPVTYLSATQASCSDFFYSRVFSTVSIYAKVSDGENEVLSPQREFFLNSVIQ